MKFQTENTITNEQLSYQGKVDVKSRTANNQLVKDINHYIAKPNEGNPINIYVTDDYEIKYGKGFAYEETISIVNSIIAERKINPFAQPDGLLDIFFYTNESNTVLDKNVQALISFGQRSEYGTPIASEMLMNGSMMPYDFRSSYVNEFIHFFDFHSFIYKGNNNNTFSNYWGIIYNFWLIEGGAEYGGYFFYNYPKNTYNTLKKDFIQPNRTSILNYAKQQGGYKKNLLYDVELNSFTISIKPVRITMESIYHYSGIWPILMGINKSMIMLHTSVIHLDTTKSSLKLKKMQLPKIFSVRLKKKY